MNKLLQKIIDYRIPRWLGTNELVLIIFSGVAIFIGIYLYCFFQALDVFNHTAVHPKHMMYGVAWWEMTKRKVYPFMKNKVFVRR